MTNVHVDELHTELVPTGPDRAPSPGKASKPPPGVAEERWREARCDAERLARRVAAEGFDD